MAANVSERNVKPNHLSWITSQKTQRESLLDVSKYLNMQKCELNRLPRGEKDLRIVLCNPFTRDAEKKMRRKVGIIVFSNGTHFPHADSRIEKVFHVEVASSR